MPTAPIPNDEATRLAALAGCRILDTPDEDAFDDLAKVAAEICGAPIALVTLIDADRQWFKARVNFEPKQVERRLSFCAHAILGREPLVVFDMLDDPRFSDNPLVTGDPRFRFYAGVPLRVDEGSAIGTLCVLDRAPRDLTAAQLEGLRAIGRQIARELRLRRELERARTRTRTPGDAGAPLVQRGDVVAGRWRVEERLGQGNVGAVFEVRGTSGERAAIKILLPDWLSQESVVERFVREAQVLRKLHSPNVARLLDVGNLEGSGLPFLVLEYLEGTDLDQVLTDRGPIAWREATAWAAAACDGVAEAHDLGVVHRDLKPSNLFLAKGADGESVVKVIDFGIAKAELAMSGAGELTLQDAVIGSPSFMSPEQMIASRDVDGRTDVWSMGALLYELITGELPFPGQTSIEVCAGVLARPPLPLRAHVADVPAPVEAIIRRCLEKQRGARFATMRELASALRDSARAAASPGY